MCDIISLSKKREEKELNEALNPYSEKSSFNFELDSLSISALLFIDEYLRPDLEDKSYFDLKMRRQFNLSCKVSEYILKNNLKIFSKNEWCNNGFESNSNNKKFIIKSISNPNFFNFVLNSFPNKGLNGSAILQIAIYNNIQLFYNFINNCKSSYVYPSIEYTKKKAMKYDNGRLVEILSEIENTDCSLDFLPSFDRYEVALID